MSNSEQAPVDPKLTTWELQFITSKLHAGETPMTIATDIVASVKKNFNIDRTHHDILEAIHAISDGLLHPPLLPQQPPLFKSFEQHPTIEPIKPKRTPLIPFKCCRKVPPREQNESRTAWSLQSRLDELEQINEECSHTIERYDRKLNKRAPNKELNSVNENITWFYNEYFYSNYDRKYLTPATPPLKQLQTHLFECEEITYAQHCKMLSLLPRPRLLDDEQLAAEKLKLEEHRNYCRQKSRSMSKNNEASEFPVHSVVLALHPMCGHLHTGTILAIYKENQYMVKFMKPELPTQKILDVNMSTEFTQSSRYQSSRQDLQERNGPSVNNENIYSDIVDNINFDITAFLIKTLTLKSSLVEALRNINDQEGSRAGDAAAAQWIIQVLKKMEPIVQQTIVRFRLRGINENNSKPFFSNFSNILINPLKIMSKDFENSSDQGDQNAASQIKSIISKERQSQVNSALKNAMSSMQDQQVDPSDLAMIQVCMGILADLKHEGKGFDIQNNPNLLKLTSLTKENYTEEFNELYEKLFSMVSKVRE